jgi:phage tail-like protein
MGTWSFGEFDSLVANAFSVEIGGTPMNVKEVSGLKKEFDFIEVKTQTITGKYVLRKIPGREKPVTLTITRPLTDDPFFDKWMNDTKDGVVQRKDVTVKILAPGPGGATIKTYLVKQCQPSAVEVTQVQAGSTTALDEKVTLQGWEVTVS